MKIAIHHRKGSFSERWIEYCEKNDIKYKLVNAYDSDIIKQVEDCDAMMWHHDHNNYKDLLVAKKVLFTIEHSGKVVFPNFKTNWHFDDKVAQKYLLESIKAPLVPSYVFYDKREAIDWVEATSFPKVFKLKGGSGSSNVLLIETKGEAIRIIKKSFGKGISGYNYKGYANEKWRHFKNNGRQLKDLLKIIYRLFKKAEFYKHTPKERDYVYFQDFIPNNSSDIRVIVIDNKAFALKRIVRENDFRASGSGMITYDIREINPQCIEIAFTINQRLKSQCVAFDFIFNENNEPLIVEISYGFAMEAYNKCPGYWDQSLNWYEGEFNPQGWILKNVTSKL